MVRALLLRFTQIREMATGERSEGWTQRRAAEEEGEKVH